MNQGGSRTIKTVTTLRKISYNKGKLKAAAQGKVKGYLNDTFSLDEYKGNLRLFTTNNDENLVTILDKKLDKISTIENLAKGETIYLQGSWRIRIFCDI